jgi:hypothetical protein
MVRKIIRPRPRINSTEIKIGEPIGRGQRIEKTIVNSAKVIEKTGKKRRFNAAAKIPSKIMGHDSTRKRLAESQSAYRKLRNVGLPVPDFSVVSTKSRTSKGKLNEHYLTTFMENMQRRYGKIYDGHTQGRPTFLSKLCRSKNRGLIKALGEDLAKIHSLGLSCNHLDFWHFYKTQSGSFNRIILDFESFRILKDKKIIQRNLRNNILDAKKNFGKEEFQIFMDAYFKKYRGDFAEQLIASTIKK